MVNNLTKNEYSIGIVTYHARLEKYFIPLIEKLTTTFPDKEIVCVINGHPDKDLQIKYLKKVTNFLSKFHNIRYLTNETHQSLSKCWNQTIILSNTEKILILNDDTQVTSLFREEFEKKILPEDFAVINLSWSHFLISKNIIKKVGWFDERFLGIGNEDGDYRLRMTMINIPVKTISCSGIKNYVAEQDNPSWKTISKNMEKGGRYSEVNSEMFDQKWITQDSNPEMKHEDFKFMMSWNTDKYYFSPITQNIAPMFYSFECLENNREKTGTIKYQKNKSLILLQKTFYSLKKQFKTIVKKLVK